MQAFLLERVQLCSQSLGLLFLWTTALVFVFDVSIGCIDVCFVIVSLSML